MIGVTGTVVVTVTTGVSAQAYPGKPLRILVGFSPGGASDITTRILGQKLAEAFGQPVVTDNRAGASGAIAARIVAQSSPDGYTLLSGATSILAINPAMMTRPGYESSLWYGLLLPAAASSNIVAKLNNAVNDALRAPDLIERFAALGAEPVGSSAGAFGKSITEEIAKWGSVIKSAGIRGE